MTRFPGIHEVAIGSKRPTVTLSYTCVHLLLLLLLLLLLRLLLPVLFFCLSATMLPVTLPSRAFWKLCWTSPASAPSVWRRRRTVCETPLVLHMPTLPPPYSVGRSHSSHSNRHGDVIERDMQIAKAAKITIIIYFVIY